MQMTPRAWRLIVYITVGMSFYGMVPLFEKAIDDRLALIDARLKEVEKIQYTDTPPAVEKTPAESPS